MENQQTTPVNPLENIIPINEIEIKPILTQNIDKELEVEDDDQYLLRFLLRFIVTESIKIEWEDNANEKRFLSQTFLVEKFKEYLLPVIFPKCSSDYTIEKNKDLKLVSAEFLENYSPIYNKYPIDVGKIYCYQEEVVRWLAELVNIDHPNLYKHRVESLPRPKESTEENKRETINSLKSSNSQTKSSSIDNVFVKFDKDILKLECIMLHQMHEILFKNEDNVNIINQLFQHAFYLPLQYFKTHLSVIYVYKSWLFSIENRHPPFMLDCSPSVDIKGITAFNESINEANQKVKISVTMQKVIFTNIATVFLQKYKTDLNATRSTPTKKLQSNVKLLHSELIKKIILLIYRRAVYNISNVENEHLMNVLLDIGFNVLSCYSPLNRPDNHWISIDATIGQFFQTLNVLMLKSNLVSHISDEIWERYLKVYSSLTDWISVIKEWEKTLELLLKMLGKILYNVDMSDLPLDKKERRGRRAKKTTMPRPIKKPSLNDDSILTVTHDPNQLSFKSNTMNPFMDFQPNISFIEGLHQNSEDVVFAGQDQKSMTIIKSDVKEMNPSEFNRPLESVEIDPGSFAYSSHEETSSYLSAEDSSSPQCKEKNAETSAGLQSDNEFIPLSSSGGDTSMEGNSSFDTSIKPMYNGESEDINIDADDESEGEIIDNPYYDGESKSATLTRDESDVDIASQLCRFSTQDAIEDSSRTPTKHASRRKNQQLKRGNRHSMNIDDNIVNAISDPQDLSNQDITSHNLNDHHVLLGGSVIGWNPESAVLLWKRYIGLLGNVTQIKNMKNLLSIFEYFSELTDSFIKMRENMCIPNANQVTPAPPVYIPPIEYIVPWLFQILKFDSEYDSIKLIALKILCKITVRKLDIEPSVDHLAQFYKLIHSIIQSDDKIYICSLISNLGFHFFSMALAGSEIIILDLIKACETVLKISDRSQLNLNEIPKLEAISLLCQMLKLHELNGTFKVFDSTTKHVNIIDSVSYKSNIINILINTAKGEPELNPRILSIICISLHCYSELQTASCDCGVVRHCILQLLSFMRFDHLEIATISVEMIRFLVNCCAQVQEKLPAILEQIIQVLAWTINQTWIKYRKSMCSNSRKLLTTSIFTLVDWAMHLPLSQLLDSNDLHSKGLLYMAFCALENVLKDTDYSSSSKLHMSNINKTKPEKKTMPDVDKLSRNITPEQQATVCELKNDPLVDFKHLFENLMPVRNSPDRESFNDKKLCELVMLAARMALCHLINNIGQFPKNNVLGDLSSCVHENHDFQIVKVKSLSDGFTENVNCDDLSPEIFNTPDLQMFVVNGSMLVSFIALNSKLSKSVNQFAPGGPPITKPSLGSQIPESEVRVIIRDLCGKYCWDVSFVNKYEPSNIGFKPSNEQENMPPSPPPRRTLPTNVVTEKQNSLKAAKVQKSISDHVDILLTDLKIMNPEIFNARFPKTSGSESSQSSLEALSKRQILEQSSIENNLYDNHHCQKISHPKIVEKKVRSFIPFENPPDPVTLTPKFYFCRQILTQLGFLSWKRRSSIDLVQKNKILLDLKTIDQRRGRETHKIAILYVGWGQEDKESILGNTSGSLEFNTFVSGLGWTVNLETHKGFMGGLEASGCNGCYAPYYANSTLEIMFHVSTWMPSDKPGDKPLKFKHLGNDEVMVIWSENYRDYRSHITKTEFGDVMIIIYPLRNGLFAITIKTKTDTKLFGPLYDGAIVGETELPVLVRATAVNAGRKIRESKQHYQEFFAERATYLGNTIKNYCDPMSFEDFAEHIYGIPVFNQDDSLQTNSSTEISPIINSVENNKNLGFVSNELNVLSAIDSNNKGRDSIISVDWSNIRVNDFRK